MRTTTMAALACLATASAAAQPPPTDAGPPGERRLPVTWVLGGAPSEEYGSGFVGCELVVRDGSVSVACPLDRTIACTEVLRRDLMPDPGDEIVLGCGTNCEFTDTGPVLGPYQVVAVVGAGGPVAGIATTADMSCGSTVRVVGSGPRFRLLLQGGGEDGSYRATYGFRRGHFERVGFRYVESTY